MPRTTLPIFQALPAYQGGKRDLVRINFALLAEAAPFSRGQTLLDPFLGGGAVSLFAKRCGYRVLCNDIARRSAIVGKALIENGSVKLTSGDLGRMLALPATEYEHRAKTLYYPSVFPRAHAQLLDRVLHNIQPFPEPTRSLALLLVIKWTLRIQPMSQLRGTDARAANGGDLDRVSPRRLKHYMDAQKLLLPAAWERLMNEVNAGVFPGSGAAEQGDAFTYIRGHQGDVVYLDPPYPGTASYEKEYAVLDDLLEETIRPVSGFSKSADLLKDLFQACTHVPVWLVSLNNATLELEQLEALIRPHRNHLKSVEVPYRHLGSIASEAKNARNREFVVVAW